MLHQPSPLYLQEAAAYFSLVFLVSGVCGTAIAKQLIKLIGIKVSWKVTEVQACYERYDMFARIVNLKPGSKRFDLNAKSYTYKTVYSR